MARCGCSGGCGCRFISGAGISITGTGAVDTPVQVALQNPLDTAACDIVAQCVGTHMGAGMRYDAAAKKIAAAISADGGNNMVVGTDGGLYSSGGTGGSSDNYATVDSLVARTTPFVGGSYGAGLSLCPEGGLRTYQVAMDMGLPLIHVPVRRTREQFLVAQGSRQLGDYNGDFAGDTTDGTDLAMARRMVYLPGGGPTGSFASPDYADQDGYFGFHEPWQHGMPLLSDVFEAVGRRTVLYLEVKDIGVGAGDVASPSITFALLKSMILQWGLTKSVIVAAEFSTTATTDELTQIIAGLQSLRDIGVAVGAHLTTDAEVNAVPPANVTGAGLTWVSIAYPTADTRPATVKAYKDAGLHVLLFGVHRQWQWTLVNDTTKFGTGGLKGVLAADPVYVAGAINNYSYRTQTATWDSPAPDYGRHSNWSDTTDGQRDRYRGYVIDGDAGNISLDGDVLLPTDTSPSAYRPSAYYILQGEQCPVPLHTATNKYDNYDIDVSFIWDAMVGDSDSWMGVWFGNPEDRFLYEWTQCDTHTKGYQFQLDQAGMFHMSRYDGVPNSTAPPYAYNADWGTPWTGHIAAHTEYRVKVRVRPTYITCGPVDQAETGPDTWTFNTTLGGGDLWRGPYVYLGRHFAYTADSTRCRWRNLVITPQP